MIIYEKFTAEKLKTKILEKEKTLKRRDIYISENFPTRILIAKKKQPIIEVKRHRG